MTRIAFWNLQRLGAGTNLARKKVLTSHMDYWDPDLLLTCELTRMCAYPRPQNLTYRIENPRQLCYGAQDDTLANVGLTQDTPDWTIDFKNAGFKGGTNFTKLADRALGQYTLAVGGGSVEVYVIHAPSGRTAGKRAMAYVAAGLEHRHGAGQPWIVVGDLNVTPQILGAVRMPFIHGLIKRSGNPTHYYARTRKFSELDYALSNIPGLRVRTMRHGRWKRFSDHGPILLEF